ncbi:hypothetical protein IQ07DRAFT_612905 [Pyrenochaeta sp. DS3sAY3a]|nr:hypothetical protein IQ07DRAFT_612905 [Pyrenochaeta sp. DS3sAY3a]
MNLLAGYSDSESEGEAPPVPKPAPKPAPKPSFQKVVDRSNPGRIKLNLPGASQPKAEKDDIQDDAPPAKKPRLGGAGAFGGFNAMLPAPKKPNPAQVHASAIPEKRGLGKGLAAGVSLKTGAEPAFKREPRVELNDYDENGNIVKKEPLKKEDFRAMLNLPSSKSEQKPDPKPALPVEADSTVEIEAPKPAAPMFFPMSVKKSKKKKPLASRPPVAPVDQVIASTTLQPQATDSKPVRKSKVSLFGVSQEETAPKEPQDGHYQPLLYGAENEDETTIAGAAFAAPPVNYAPQHMSGAAPTNQLSNIASELNLSESERRQLFGKKGRNGPDFSSAKIVEFNTDTEYAHNEKLRQHGEQAQQHNPLKSISGTGKNSLRSLVSAASTQKDALEDHFAAGHRNKREAGNRYGW